MESLQTSIVSIRYRSPERTWLVANMKQIGTNNYFTAAGDIIYAEPEEALQIYGEWIEDKKYGKQFKVTSSHRVLPKDLKGIEKYLSASEDIKGIGPIRASKLREHFGSKLLEVLEGNPKTLLQCQGISIELAESICRSWKNDKSKRDLSIFLAKYNISPKRAGNILKQWDAGTAVNRITKNPYCLTEIEGIGFITADEAAIASGWKKDCQERIDAACIHVVQQSVQDGNVFTHEFQLVDDIVKLICPRGKDETKIREQAIQSIENAIADKKLIVETINDGIADMRLLYLPYLYEAEKGLASSIRELNKGKITISSKLEQAIQKVQEHGKIKFSDKQIEAIRRAFNSNTLVINGGPGTGKTTCVRAICEIAEELHLSLGLAAPTGRAAKRLSEVTNRNATTIHRLLQWGHDGPRHTRENPIDVDILIVDESSMLDLNLGYKLFECIPTKSTVIFIGDANQLPAVSAGTVLRDIINSNTVPVVTLATIFRQAEQSLIIRNSHLISKGEMPRFPETKGIKEDSYVMWIPANSNKDIAGKDDAEWLKSRLAQLVTTHIAKHLSVAGGSPINPIKDIQVLVPMRKNTIGSNELNKVLQESLNPKGEEFVIGDRKFRYGDRVMQTKNNYDEGREVYNGDIGFIRSYSREDKLVAIDFDGRTISYDAEAMQDIQLAYAQTIHKAQGSEYRVTIIIMAYQHWPMLERNLVYTANTRARELCIFMAAKGAIERAVKNNPVKNRNSYLSKRLKELHA